MANQLVTGGLGFIGGWLTHELLRDAKARVIAVDHLSGSVFTAEEIAKSIREDTAGELEVQVKALADFDDYRPLENVYHLASIVGPAGVLEHSGRIVETIVADTYRAAEIAMRREARLVNVSTSEVYGGGQDGYCHERAPRVIKAGASARLEYAAAKLAGEIALENLCTRGWLDVVTVRPFNVAGPRQCGAGGFVVPRFVGQALLGRPLTVFGDGKSVRALTDVRDIAAGLCIAARYGRSGATYNIGNPANRIAIGDLADVVLAVTKSAAGKTFVEPTSIYGPSFAEAADKYPNADKLMELGWRPKHGVEAIVRSVVDFMAPMPAHMIARVAGLGLADAELEVDRRPYTSIAA